MAKRHPQEAKDQAAALYAEGLSTHEVGRRLGVAQPTIHRWVSPKGQAYDKAYCADPEVKERRKEYMKEYSKAWRADPANREREKKRLKAYHTNPVNKVRQKAYYADPKVKERKNGRKKERYATDPAFRILDLLRNRTRDALKGGIKSAGTEELLGISALELTQRWDTEYGPGWQEADLHIDHIRPCSSFDLLDPAQQRLCFNHRNLQLLPAVENMSKGDSWTPEMEAAWVARMLDLGWEGGLFLVFPAQPTSRPE